MCWDMLGMFQDQKVSKCGWNVVSKGRSGRKGSNRCADAIRGRSFRQGERKGFHSKWNGKLREVFKHS